MDQNDDQPKPEGAVQNWVLLETEIKNVLLEGNWRIVDNNVGDACLFAKDNNNRELNITHLARALSPRVLVRIRPLSATEVSATEEPA
jgi:hypothetical protein